MTKKVPAHPMLPVGVLPISVRDQEGRYSIEEAGMMLDSETNNGGRELLMNAAAAGGLKVYAPGNNAQFPVDQIRVNRDYLEAYWDDLNVWLKANAPRIKFEFPAPESEPVTTTAEPAAKGVTTAQIVDAFGGLVNFGLGKAMTDRTLWTCDARITSGTKGGRYKSLWCPVIMATALHELKNVPMPKLNKAFNTCNFLADWREEWNRFSTM
jgi:hypothetical protein